MSVFSSPLFLGFEDFERLFEQASKSTEGYPPYNIKRFAPSATTPEGWQITLAVAGFASGELEVTVENRQLSIRGANREGGKRDYLHRGIAGRSFAKSFVLADGMEVESAHLENGLLVLTLIRRAAEKKILRIDVKD